MFTWRVKNETGRKEVFFFCYRPLSCLEGEARNRLQISASCIQFAQKSLRLWSARTCKSFQLTSRSQLWRQMSQFRCLSSLVLGPLICFTEIKFLAKCSYWLAFGKLIATHQYNFRYPKKKGTETRRGFVSIKFTQLTFGSSRSFKFSLKVPIEIYKQSFLIRFWAFDNSNERQRTKWKECNQIFRINLAEIIWTNIMICCLFDFGEILCLLFSAYAVRLGKLHALS